MLQNGRCCAGSCTSPVISTVEELLPTHIKPCQDCGVKSHDMDAILFQTMKEIEIYCDGSAIGNPGPGGWGAVILLDTENEKRIVELGAFETHTTNNRMELTAGMEALKHLKAESVVTIKTDSQYVINGITKWVFGWEKNGWQTKDKKDVSNKDLWQELVKASRKHTVTWEHVRGHEGVALNERVDVIANGTQGKN